MELVSVRDHFFPPNPQVSHLAPRMHGRVARILSWVFEEDLEATFSMMSCL